VALNGAHKNRPPKQFHSLHPWQHTSTPQHRSWSTDYPREPFYWAEELGKENPLAPIIFNLTLQPYIDALNRAGIEAHAHADDTAIKINSREHLLNFLPTD